MDDKRSLPEQLRSFEGQESPTMVIKPAMNRITVVVEGLHVNSRISFTVYEISVETEKTEWRETFGSIEHVRAFIRGVRAGAAAANGTFHVEIVDRRDYDAAPL